MLQILTKPFDIFRVSKLLAKYNIKADISKQSIILLGGEIPDEFLSELLGEITICSIQNFGSEEIQVSYEKTDYPESDTMVSATIDVGDVAIETHSNMVHVQTKYDVRYHTVRRGELYICDFGKPFGCEQGYQRYAIVVQNDTGNCYSPTTIVVPCSSRPKKSLPTHHKFNFADRNMEYYCVDLKGRQQENSVMTEQIRTVDKARLIKLLGCMTTEFMDSLQENIDISLGLKRQVITKMEEGFVNNGKSKYMWTNNYEPKGVLNAPVHEPVDIYTTTIEHKELSDVQEQLLSLIDSDKLSKIAKTEDPDEIKAEKIIRLFGFDMKKNGVQYLIKAIVISLKETHFNLETLCDSISKSERNIIKDEVKRLIVARIKEQFSFKKSPTIDFIRLVNHILIEGGLCSE